MADKFILKFCESNYTCKICFLSFNRSFNAKRHIRAVHREVYLNQGEDIGVELVNDTQKISQQNFEHDTDADVHNFDYESHGSCTCSDVCGYSDEQQQGIHSVAIKPQQSQIEDFEAEGKKH